MPPTLPTDDDDLGFDFPHDLPRPTVPSARIRTSELDPVTYYLLKVGAKLTRRNIATQSQVLLSEQVFQWWRTRGLEILKYEAAQDGMSPTEKFRQIARNGDEE